MEKKTTSWGGVAEWYEELLAEEKTYQKEVILPNLLRLMEIKKSETVLDLACGTGFFAKEFLKAGAKVMGVDISKELIAIAEKNVPEGEFAVSPADALPFLKEKSIDKVAIVLSIQNIENMKGVCEECARVLRPEGALFVVMNHPAFRVPGASSWDWDHEKQVQYRRIEAYLSERRVPIAMHPGADPKAQTISFHRPLQLYFKALAKAGFCVSRFEEWNSNKKSQPGPRAALEDRARKEFPLFLCLRAVKCP